MNFFAAQDRARRTSKWLVVVYLIVTALIVFGVTALVGLASYAGFPLYDTGDRAYAPQDLLATRAPLLIATATITALVILGASLFRTASLSAGGGRVAQQMGGVPVPADVSDPLRQRLRNVVEEMAIASGMPVPEIYVLEEEMGINAFAAGYAPGDAAIAVTRGTLELLDRDELQGVIGHEFSHVLNGDMRLNIRLMGILFGILLLGLIGRVILRGSRGSRFFSSRRDRGAPLVLIVGVGLVVLGGIGVFCARLIKAAVSRQREFLADASAVQFTRQTSGIANALKKIGGYRESSYLTAADPEEISHMLFGSGSRLSGLFATHPPLAERIRSLDPAFDEADYPRVDATAARARREQSLPETRVDGVSAAFASNGGMLSPATIVASVGNPDVEHVAYARLLRQSIPETLYSAAHSIESAYLLALALILDRSGKSLSRQLDLLEERIGPERTRMVRGYYEELASTGAEYRLPLQEISFPALKRRPAPQLGFLTELAGRLIEVDGRVDLYEYCFYRILLSNLGQAASPQGGLRKRRTSGRALRAAAVNLLAMVASRGHASASDEAAAFAHGAAVLGDWAEQVPRPRARELTVRNLDRSLDVLAALSGKGRRRVLSAITATAAYDEHIDVVEAEMIRAVCAALDCPLPPILVRAHHPKADMSTGTI